MSMLTELWEWIDADGNVYPFTAAYGVVAGQASGDFWMPPTKRVQTAIPGRPGVYVTDRSYKDRVGALQVVFDTRTYAPSTRDQAVEEILAAWAARFNVLRGQGQLRHTRLDGVRRVLRCEYEAGMGVDQGQGVWRKGVQPAVLMFHAGDPAWYDDADSAQAFTTTAGGSFFPIPNASTGSFVTLVSSTVFGNATVNNTGDMDAYPVWTITGPGAGITLRNTTTGKQLSLTQGGGLTLAAGSVLTIDTRAGSTKLQLADGTNEAAYLTDASELWPMQRGNNVIQVEMGSSTGASAVSIAYRKAWLTP